MQRYSDLFDYYVDVDECSYILTIVSVDVQILTAIRMILQSEDHCDTGIIRNWPKGLMIMCLPEVASA